MKLNGRQIGMLRSLQHRPRTARDFTHGDQPIAPNVVLMYLDAMEEGGYIEQSASGIYSITRAGEVFLHNLPGVAPPQTFGNYSMPAGSLVLPKWGRNTGNEQIKSRTSFGADLTSDCVVRASTAGESHG